MKKEKSKFSAVGGQALIEGVMMRGKDKIAISIRKSDGEIITKVDDIKKTWITKFSKIPILRGVLIFVSSMIVGIKALNYSAEFFDDGADYEKGKFDKFIEKKFGDKADSVYVAISMVFALLMTVVFFLALPAFVSSKIRLVVENTFLIAGIEGIFKFSLFLGYILLISKMKEVRRVFEYHGAEHKSISCLEAKEELTPENAKKFSRLHPRCGTSFMLVVVVVSIILFAFLKNWESPLLRVGLKLLFMPVVAGISYEIIRFAGKSKSKLVRMISYPGMMLQKITTNEPDDSQLEVAIEALKAVLDEDEINYGEKNEADN